MSPSNEFLSGEADPKLGSMLGSLHISSDFEKAKCAKIQVLESKSDTNIESDDESPPPLDCINDSKQNSNASSEKIEVEEGESLMEQMMKEATKAREVEKEKKRASELKNAKSSSFGLKKGFLNSSKPKKKKKKKAVTQKTGKGIPNVERGENDKNQIYELDSEGNMIPAQFESGMSSSTNHTSTRNNIETIPKPNPTSHKNNPLHMQEVQDAMNGNKGWANFANKDWSSPELLDRISKNPILLAGMQNPKFTAALEALKSNPKEAMKKFKDHKDVTEFLNEFCSVLGDHFTKLGEMQEQNVTETDVGPMAYSAIQKENERKAKGEQSLGEGMTREEQEQVDSIMKDKDLTEILMDVDMQRVMQECSTIPGKMQMYMQHEEYGKKLRKLIQAGLLRFA